MYSTALGIIQDSKFRNKFSRITETTTVELDR